MFRIDTSKRKKTFKRFILWNRPYAWIHYLYKDHVWNIKSKKKKREKADCKELKNQHENGDGTYL